MLAPPLKLLGGGAGPPWPPLFLRLCWKGNACTRKKLLMQYLSKYNVFLPRNCVKTEFYVCVVDLQVLEGG